MTTHLDLLEVASDEVRDPCPSEAARFDALAAARCAPREAYDAARALHNRTRCTLPSVETVRALRAATRRP